MLGGYRYPNAAAAAGEKYWPNYTPKSWFPIESGKKECLNHVVAAAAAAAASR